MIKKFEIKYPRGLCQSYIPSAGIESMLMISVFVPGAGWDIGAGLVLGLIVRTGINYCAQLWKDEWIDGGK